MRQRPSKIGRTTLRRAANWEALTTYRAAFKAGTLGSSHAEVVESVYQLAADELLNRWRIERRAGRQAIAVLVLALGTAIAVHKLNTWVDMGVQALAFIAAVSMVDHYAAAHAFRVGAVLLVEPEPRRKPDEPRCGHRWRGPSTRHEHICTARPGKHGRHQCECGFWVSTADDDTAVITLS